MLNNIIKLSIQNKFLVIIFVFILIGWGTYSMLNIPLDAVPDITNNQVQIVTVSPSLAAKEVEQFITYPIEMVMANIQDVEEIRSISRYGLSVVTVVFNKDVPVLDARQLVGQLLQTARKEIPSEYGEPYLMPITTGLGEIYQYTVDVKPGFEGKYTAEDLRTIHDWVVKRQLNGIPGIVEISSFGGFIKQYEVAVNPQALSKYNLTLLDVNNALKSNNQNTGGSYIQKGPYAYYIRTDGLISGISDIEQIVVSMIDDIPLKISDIAEVRIGNPSRFGAMTKDGKGEAVGGITLMLKGGNSSKVISEVKQRMEQIQKNLPEGVEINPYLDRSVLVKRVIDTVKTNLLEGGLIVIFVLVLLLGNLRAGLIVASLIPLSMLFAFGLMKTFGVTATVMSLGAIDFGLIVDATVIIIESIIYQIEHRKQRLNASEMDDLVLNSTLKIKNSALFGAIIILIVYVPILALTGVEGKMFRPMALTVGFAIIGALILSFTYVPVVSSLFLSKYISDKKTIADKIMDLLYRTYSPVFDLALRLKKTVLLIAVGLFFSSVILFNFLGAEFLPDLDEGDLAMQMTVPPGSSLNESILTSTKAEKILLDNFPEVITVVSKIGTAEVPTDPMAIEDADIMIVLKPHSEWTSAENRAELVDKMKEKLSVIAGASFEFTQPIQLRFNELLTGSKSDVAIKIYGEDLGVLFDKANEAAKIISKVQGAGDIKVEQIEGLPQLVISYKRDRIARYGLNIEEINTMIRTALAGETVGIVFEGERKFDLVVRLQKEYRTDFNEFKNFYVKTPNGIQIPLQEVANIEFKDSPTQVSRDNTHRRISIGVNVRNRDVQSLVQEIQKELDTKLILPTGYYVTYGGKFENLNSAVTRLKIVVPIALGMIFLLLYFAFGTIKQALLISFTIPLSIIGGIFALWIRGLPFSISAGIGFIALFGVAVLDGIVLINYLNELKDNKIDDLNERLKQATKSRLRPVVVTSAVASLGFLPMAISNSAGAEVQRPLATVVIGGVITAAFLTMIILPLVYYYFEKGIKIKIPKKTLLLFAFLIPALGFSQTTDTSYVNLTQAKEILLKNNLEIKNASLNLRKMQYSKQNVFDLGKTDFQYQNGQINSYLKDYSFTITQNLGNPVENIARNSYNGTESKFALNQIKIVENKKIFDVSILYYKWQMLNHKNNIYDSLIFDFKKIIEISELQYKTGETDYLSKISMENKLKSMIYQQKEIVAELNYTAKEFQQILFSDTVFVPETNKLELLEFQISDSLSNISNSPIINSFDLETEIAQRKIQLEKSKLFPEFNIGYFNQQIDGVEGFKGFEAGMSMNLWFFQQRKNIKSSAIESEIAMNNKEYYVGNLTNQSKLMTEKFKIQNQEIQYFKQTGINSSQIIMKNAKIKFLQGEISYYEYLQALQTASEIQLSYAEKIFELNTTIITLNYLTGKK